MDRTTGARITEGDHIDQCVENILTTQPGQRPMQLEYGTDKLGIADSAMTQSGRARIVSTTAGAVIAYETRPMFERVEVIAEAGSVDVTLHYSVDGSQRATGVAL